MIFCAVLAILASMQDLRERKISNKWSAALFLLILSLRLLYTGGLLDKLAFIEGFDQAFFTRQLQFDPLFFDEVSQLGLVLIPLAWAFCFSFVLVVFECSYRAFRRARGLGFGDVKFLGALSLYFMSSILGVLLLASLLALLTACIRKKKSFAFVPFISIASALLAVVSILV